jgi:hypothetical protein
MSNKAMKERHWERIAQVTGYTFDFEAENFVLRNIMEAPLLKYKDDIEVLIARTSSDTICNCWLKMLLCNIWPTRLLFSFLVR